MRWPPRQQRKQDRPQAIDVAGWAGLPQVRQQTSLLGCHVVRCPQHLPRHGQALVARLVRRQTEIGQLHHGGLPRLGRRFQQHIGWLQIAVDNSERMGGGDRLRQLDRPPHRLADRNLSSLNLLLQRSSREPLHQQVGRARRDPRRMNRHHVRMTQPTQQLRFTQNAGRPLPTWPERQQLDRHQPVRRPLPGPVHHPRPPAPHLGEIVQPFNLRNGLGPGHLGQFLPKRLRLRQPFQQLARRSRKGFHHRRGQTLRRVSGFRVPTGEHRQGVETVGALLQVTLEGIAIVGVCPIAQQIMPAVQRGTACPHHVIRP